MPGILKRKAPFGEEVEKEEPSRKKMATPDKNALIAFRVGPGPHIKNNDYCCQVLFSTLEKDRNTLLYKIATGEEDCKKEDGAFVITECKPDVFNALLDFLREKEFCIGSIDPDELLRAAKRFKFSSLLAPINNYIKKEKEKEEKEKEEKERVIGNLPYEGGEDIINHENFNQPSLDVNSSLVVMDQNVVDND